jgi:hypothetical protein
VDGADAVAVVARRKGKRVPLREFLDELAPRCPCALCDLALQSGRSPAVKLYKILWFADIEHYRLTGRSITGAASYTKRQYGPVPKGIMQALTTLEGEGKIAKSSANYYGGPKTMFLACERPDLQAFHADEIAIVDMVASAICERHTAASVSELTHNALWAETEIGNDMPIGAASVINGEVTPEDMDWAAKVFAA